MAATTSGEAGAFIPREKLKDIPNAFVLNIANIGYLLGDIKTRPVTARRNIPLLLLVLGVFVVGCPATMAASANDGGAGLWLVTAVLVVLFAVGIVVTWRQYRREAILDKKGKYLVGQITAVSARERENYMTLMTQMTGDFYEVSIQYTTIAPDGTQISGTAKQNRPDLRGNLPSAGDASIILYADAAHYKLM